MITQGKGMREFWSFFGGNEVPWLKTLRKAFFPLKYTYVIKNN